MKNKTANKNMSLTHGNISFEDIRRINQHDAKYTQNDWILGYTHRE
jgi:hypothetical protein